MLDKNFINTTYTKEAIKYVDDKGKRHMGVITDKMGISTYMQLPELAFGIGKSVQPAYKFLAYFLPNPNSSADTEPIVRLDPWHITGVTLPNYKFQVNTVMYGALPRLFSTLNFQGLTVIVSFEEDAKGTIAYFINWLQRQIIDSKGYYNAPLKSRVGHLVVSVLNGAGVPVMHYVYRNLVFQDATDPKYEYISNDVIRYDITFSAEIVEQHFAQY